MRLREAIRLGHLNISSHKRRNLIVVIVIGVIFGVLFAGNMLLQGLEDGVLDVLVRRTDGEVYLQVSGEKYAENSGLNDAIGEVVTDEEVRRSLEGVNGELVGELPIVAGYLALPREVAEKFTEVNLDEVPEGEVPLLSSVSQASYLLQMSIPERGKVQNRINVLNTIRQEAVGQSFDGMWEYFVVGVMPGGGVHNLALANVDSKSNPLDVILEQVSVDGGGSYVVEMEGLEIDEGNESALSVSAPYLVKFADAREALKYSRSKGVCYASYYSCQEGDLVVSDAFGGVLATVSHIGVMKMVLWILSIVLAVVAFIVMYFTVMRLIGQDGRTISLYYALGATGRDVGKIYFCYIMELAILALGFAVMLGVAMMVIVSLVNAKALTMVLYLAYGVEGHRLWLIGWNAWGWVLAGIMMAMAGICYLGNCWQFAVKRLGKKLKN